MTAILTAAITSGGTIVAAALTGAAGYLGARRGTRAELESSRAERMWQNRAIVYEELAKWVRERREVTDERATTCLKGDTVQLVPLGTREAQEGFLQAGQLEVWASDEVRHLLWEFSWWNDWTYMNIVALQDPDGEGKFIVASRSNLSDTFGKAKETADRLIEQIRVELAVL